jgi:hypothetical protein
MTIQWGCLIFHIWGACTWFLFLYSVSRGPARTKELHRYFDSHITNHCATSFPIGRSEFLDRQRDLAKSLVELNSSAYIAEPGANARFYFNVSTLNWFLSERPLLLIITPLRSADTVEAKVSVLTPKVIISPAREGVI